MKRFFLLCLLPLAACTVTEVADPTRKPPVPSGAESGSVRYICESGERVYIKYKESGLLLRYKNKNHQLKISMSASGARYEGNEIIWWNKGADNTLYVKNVETGESVVAEACKEAPRRQ